MQSAASDSTNATPSGEIEVERGASGVLAEQRPKRLDRRVPVDPDRRHGRGRNARRGAICD